MKIIDIELNNFSTYKGKHVFNFDSELNLIGGENGAGKTSILKAFIWTLFGHRMFNSEVATNKYREFIYATLNNNTTSKTFGCNINLIENGVNYQIKRNVKFTTDNYIEDITYYLEGKKVEQIDFLSNYSIEMIESFFFNGEDILSFINNDNIEVYINALIVKAFNLDTFKCLIKDINAISNRELKAHSTKELDKLSSQFDTLSTKKTDIEKKIKNLNNDFDKNNIALNDIENQMNAKGVLSNTKMVELDNEHNDLKESIKYLNDDIKDFFLGDALLLMQNKTLATINNELSTTRENRINDIIDNYKNINTSSTTTFEIEYNLEKKIVDRYEESKQIGTNILSTLKRRSKLSREEVTLREKIINSKEGNKYISYVDNYEYLTNDNSRITLELKQLTEQLNRLDKEYNIILSAKETEEKEILKQLQSTNSISEREKLLEIVQEYIKQQTSDVMNEVSTELNNTYFKLARKKGLVSNIEFDGFNLVLKQGKKEININTISSGEKQILIVSIILAILKVSKNNVPLVLDTFLGRLDAKHTKNLFDYINNELDYQVIILATNKEITKKEYDYLSLQNPKEYLLKNESDNTVIEEGFFNYEN